MAESGCFSKKTIFSFLMGFSLGALAIQLTIRPLAQAQGKQTISLPAGFQREQKRNKPSKPNALTVSNATLQPPTARLSPHNFSSIKQRFEDRRHLLKRQCQLYLQQREGPEDAYNGDFMTMGKQTFYCGIEKTGSTEWKRLFSRMAQRGTHVHRHVNWSVPLAAETNSSDKARDTRFIFVREPYGRLLSAYVDKILSPNVMFWNMVGRYIVRRFRHSPSRHSLRCGHDVTFAEFIDYVIDATRTGLKKNGHFTPQYKHCYVCDFPYNYVGHLETVTEDRQVLLDVMQSPVQYSTDYVLSSLENQVHWYISDQPKYNQCITVDEALRRLWQKNKIRGYLHPSFEYPLTFEQSENITINEFIKVARKEMKRSEHSSFNLKDNKRLALAEAFSSVHISKKEQLHELFRWDSQLFGYDPYPEEVFGDNAQTQTKQNWGFFKLWG